MGVFKSERRFWTDTTDLAPVVDAVTVHFRGKGYEVVAKETGAGATDIDITRAGVFRTISGLRTALKVRLEPEPGCVVARAGVGVFGQQVLPTVVSYFFLVTIFTQIWGVVRAAKLDNEALGIVEQALAASVAPVTFASPRKHCRECGSPQSGGAFCTECGAAIPTS
jgi:hypothetical protein